MITQTQYQRYRKELWWKIYTEVLHDQKTLIYKRKNTANRESVELVASVLAEAAADLAVEEFDFCYREKMI